MFALNVLLIFGEIIDMSTKKIECQDIKIEKIEHVGGIQGSIGLIRIFIDGINFDSDWMDEPKAIDKYNELTGQNKVRYTC